MYCSINNIPNIAHTCAATGLNSCPNPSKSISMLSFKKSGIFKRHDVYLQLALPIYSLDASFDHEKHTIGLPGRTKHVSKLRKYGLEYSGEFRFRKRKQRRKKCLFSYFFWLMLIFRQFITDLCSLICKLPFQTTWCLAFYHANHSDSKRNWTGYYVSKQLLSPQQYHVTPNS